MFGRTRKKSTDSSNSPSSSQQLPPLNFLPSGGSSSFGQDNRFTSPGLASPTTLPSLRDAIPNFGLPLSRPRSPTASTPISFSSSTTTRPLFPSPYPRSNSFGAPVSFSSSATSLSTPDYGSPSHTMTMFAQRPTMVQVRASSCPSLSPSQTEKLTSCCPTITAAGVPLRRLRVITHAR